jgi:hypothetical protein
MHLKVRARRAKETLHSVTELHRRRSEVMGVKETIGNNLWPVQYGALDL